MKKAIGIYEESFWETTIPEQYAKIAIGIDIGTLLSGMCVAIEAHPGDNRYYLTNMILYKCSQKTHIEDRMELIANAMCSYLYGLTEFDMPPIYLQIGIEIPPYIKANLHATTSLIGMLYIIKNKIRRIIRDSEQHKLTINFKLIQNLMWKQHLTGSGAASKQVISDSILKDNPKIKIFYNEIKKNQDIMDAYGVLKYNVERENNGMLIGQ